MHSKKTRFFRAIALMLAIMLIFPIGASSVEPRASYYLDSYNTYPYSAGWGKIQVWFNVVGVTPMDDLGAMTVQIYESTDNINFTWVKTYSHDVYTDMLGHNAIAYQSHIEYQGVIGRYYKAYVCIYAGKDGDGDTRYLWTGSQKATILAQ